MQDVVSRWEELKKALDHSVAIRRAASSAPKIDVPTEAHPDHLPKVQYGYKAIPNEDTSLRNDTDDHIGFAKVDGKQHVVRHGSAAQRTDVEHQMSKLLGADHMVPEQSYDHGLNHPDHHNKETFDPSVHGGTSMQKYHEGEKIFDALDDEKLTGKLREQWKNGDLHKLWALHYISNNGDMHGGNFRIGKDGVKSFDSDQAYYELPHGHIVDKLQDGTVTPHYMPFQYERVPTYLHPFIGRDGESESDEGIDSKYHEDQVSVKALNEHAAKIQPALFEQFGPHAAERAAKAKRALMSADPTGEMKKLWHDHEDKTGDLTWDKTQSKNKQAA